VALTFIALFAQDRWLFMLFLSLYIGFCTYMMGAAKYQYFWQVCGFVCIIICLDAGPNAVSAFETTILRVEETGLGILVYSLITIFLWPTNSKAISESGPVAETTGRPHGGFVLDPGRLASAVQVMATLWLAYLALIYVNDLPVGTTFVIMSGTLGMALSTNPQIAVSKLFVPATVGVLFASFLYIFVMPRLSSFLGLGPLIFAVTFAICYLFASPQQVLGRAFGLIMFVTIAAISNEQTYSFLSVANTAVMFALIFMLLVFTARRLWTTRPESNSVPLSRPTGAGHAF